MSDDKPETKADPVEPEAKVTTPVRSIPRIVEPEPTEAESRDAPEAFADPPGLPAPTQIRSDYLRIKSTGGDPTTMSPALPPQQIDVPFVSQAGSVLTCTMGNWTGSPSGYAYAWKRDVVTTIGTNVNNYTIVGLDSTHSITCVVTATNGNGSTIATPSNAIAVP
jgi:hypothetical protein